MFGFVVRMDYDRSFFILVIDLIMVFVILVEEVELLVWKDVIWNFIEIVIF